MNLIEAMRVYRRVVEGGGFARAARDLGLSNAWVSKTVAQLENHLGVQLLRRTTRRIHVTELGHQYYERASLLLDDLDALESGLATRDAEPRGRLRVSAPVSFGIAKLGPILPEFLARYPGIAMELVLNDRFIDLIEEGFDLALRLTTSTPDSSLVFRRMGYVSRICCASPTYLAAHGEPAHPEALRNHRCVVYSLQTNNVQWPFINNGGAISVSVSGHFTTNNSFILRETLLAGLGIGLIPEILVQDALVDGRLREVLAPFRSEPLGLYAVLPQGRRHPAKTRAFIDFLKTHLRGLA